MPEKNADGQYEVIFSDITDEFQIYVQMGYELIHVANRMENNFLHITEPAAFHWMDIVHGNVNYWYNIMLNYIKNTILEVVTRCINYLIQITSIMKDLGCQQVRNITTK